ncbi:helix-turn-helix domain-containing protein [Kaistella palustris]|uniref:helix-turn-helix domain-containing protein n=1 Tax=Kaistella palustris TaxID=493376 RepID=UPI00048600DF|nr:helix-turn-helix domain-containing protein [Kaistella palustris]
MRQSLRFLFFFVFGVSVLSAQSTSDFKMRVENSFLKLYENPDVALHAAKEIRNSARQLIVNDILAKGYLLKGDYLESVRLAFEQSEQQNPAQDLHRKLMVAREFYELNLYEQAAKILSPLLSDTQKPKFRPEDDVLYAQLFQLQARNYLALKQYDQARKDLNLSSDYANGAGNPSELVLKENDLLAAVILSEKGRKKEAWNRADRLLSDLGKIPRAVYLRSLTQQFRGELYFEEQKYDEAVQCLKSALLPVEKLSYEPLKRNIYADLLKNYLVIKNTSEYDFYKKKLAESSKSLEENKKEARRALVQLNTELLTEQTKSAAQQKKMQFFYIAGILLLMLLALGFLYVREVQRAKVLNKQIKFFRSVNLPNPQKKVQANEKENSKKPLLIPKETETEILEKLEQFEESKNYLDNNMSLATLAAQLGTNTKYLSEIINKFKDKNFNSYINELRVKHVIQLLSTDRTYLQYKISYIAEIGGFTSHSAFTNVFKSITGMSPQEYMQTLRNT